MPLNPSQEPVDARALAQRALGGVTSAIADPYLKDALRSLDRVLIDLLSLTHTQSDFVPRVVGCGHMACEYSRDATVRSLPFPYTPRPHLELTVLKYEAAVAIIGTYRPHMVDANPADADQLDRYRDNIRKRIAEYREYLALPPERSFFQSEHAPTPVVKVG